MVVAVPQDSPFERVEDLPQWLRVSTEYTSLTSRYFEKLGIEADIRLSYGATEAKVPDIVDCIVEITETGRALRAAGLKIIGEAIGRASCRERVFPYVYLSVVAVFLHKHFSSLFHSFSTFFLSFSFFFFFFLFFFFFFFFFFF